MKLWIGNFMFFQLKKNSLIVILIFCSQSFCQENITNFSLYSIEDNYNSFWMNHNKNGVNQREKTFSFHSKLDLENLKLNLNLYSNKKQIMIGESFLMYDFKENLNVKIGRYYRDFSTYLNDDLSSGSMLISNNAKPMPKIGILYSFKPKINQSITFKTGIAHAKFKSSEIYLSSPMLHEKFIYIQKEWQSLSLNFGIVHEAVWGGSTEVNGEFPDSFKDFLKVFVSADGPLLEGQEHANALGNHLGIWDFNFQWSSKEKKYSIYYQHLFEDTSGLRFDNKYDGLWGFELVDNNMNLNFLLEYLSTSNQFSNPPYVNESYYNHFEYIEGWSYDRFSIGNPFINFENTNPLELVHFALDARISQLINIKILSSKIITNSSDILYSINVIRKINRNNFISFESYGNSSKINFGIKYSVNI